MSWGDAQFDDVEVRARTFVRRERRTFRPGVQIAFVYAGVILPILCFLLTMAGPFDEPSWQSGAIDDYFAFLLSGRTGFVFFPLLLYSIISFWIALFDVRKFADTVVVQLGVYSGVILALHFSVVLYIVSFQIDSPGIELLGLPVAIAVAIFVPVGIWWGLRGAVFMLRVPEDWTLIVPGLFVGGICLFLLLLIVASFDNTQVVSGVACFPLAFVIMSSLFCNAYWAFGAYLVLAIQLARRNWRSMQFRLSHMLIVFTWLAVYLAACRASVAIALAEYAKLPTSPPSNCYIATAATRGHRRFVGARRISLNGGRTMLVNRQLVTLKCGELAICTVSPGLHRRLRVVYDWLGPRLASRITHPLIADAAYISLKPCEWTVRLALGLLIADHGRLAAGLYGASDD